MFSAGILAAALSAEGHKVEILTCFTKSVKNPKGFGLACQLDKNLSADVDYMQLRRDEDREAYRIIGAEPLWLDLPEAPHRGYNSAKELFEGIKAGDQIQRELFPQLKDKISGLRPDYIFSPVGIGNHVDHQHVCRAVEKLKRDFPAISFLRWYDQPYLYRNPSALAGKPAALHFKGLDTFEEAISDKPDAIFSVKTQAQKLKKVEACLAYRSQVNFQFGSSQKLENILTSDPESGNQMAEFFCV